MRKTQGIRGFVLGVVTTLVVCAVIVPAFAAVTSKQVTAYYSDIKLSVDGIPITPKDAAGKAVEPFIVDGTTYLPVRALAEALGKNVQWDGATSTVYVGRKPGETYYFPDFVSAYASHYYTEYSLLKSGGTQSFNMASVKYTDGMLFDCYSAPYAIYNLNGQYTSLTGLLGHVDGSSNENNTMCVFADGVLVNEIPLTWEALPQLVSIDLRGVLQLKITLSETYGHAQYAIANPVLE